jgi:hypothetical protein
MLQTGMLQALIGCNAQDRARVEFALQDLYDVRIDLRTIVIQEREVERIRYCLQEWWQDFRPIVVEAGRIILDRASGKTLRVQPSARRPNPGSPRKPRLTITVLKSLRDA